MTLRGAETRREGAWQGEALCQACTPAGRTAGAVATGPAALFLVSEVPTRCAGCGAMMEDASWKGRSEGLGFGVQGLGFRVSGFGFGGWTSHGGAGEETAIGRMRPRSVEPAPAMVSVRVIRAAEPCRGTSLIRKCPPP